MPKVKTADLEGSRLDWAVAHLEGGTHKPETCFRCSYYEERQGSDDAIQYCHHPKMDFQDGSSANYWPSDYSTHADCPISDLTPEPYSTSWAKGGPIIEREGISSGLVPKLEGSVREWYANGYRDPENCRDTKRSYGPIPLVAACRYYVTSKLGDEVEVPEALVK